MVPVSLEKCMVVKKVVAPDSGLTNSTSTALLFGVATVWVLVYITSHWPCWNRPGIAAGRPTAAILGSTFFSSTRAGSTLVSEPPNSLDISMIDDVPKVVWKPVMPSRDTQGSFKRSPQPLGAGTFFGL